MASLPVVWMRPVSRTSSSRLNRTRQAVVSESPLGRYLLSSMPPVGLSGPSQLCSSVVFPLPRLPTTHTLGRDRFR